MGSASICLGSSSANFLHPCESSGDVWNPHNQEYSKKGPTLNVAPRTKYNVEEPSRQTGQNPPIPDP